MDRWSRCIIRRNKTMITFTLEGWETTIVKGKMASFNFMHATGLFLKGFQSSLDHLKA